MNTIQSYFLCVLMAGFLTACASSHYQSVAPTNNYFCDHARQMIVAIGQDGQSAAVTYKGRNISMKRVSDASKDMVFRDHVHTLYYRSGQATLVEENTPVLTGCRLESAS